MTQEEHDAIAREQSLKTPNGFIEEQMRISESTEDVGEMEKWTREAEKLSLLSDAKFLELQERYDIMSEDYRKGRVELGEHEAWENPFDLFPAPEVVAKLDPATHQKLELWTQKANQLREVREEIFSKAQNTAAVAEAKRRAQNPAVVIGAMSREQHQALDEQVMSNQ